MQNDLNQIHDVATKLLGSHLAQWGEAILNASAGHDDNKYLGVLHALLSVRNALEPFVGGHAQDASHG
ncbi:MULTISPECIES: hypothetical protein [Paraburkholderia]|uniref:Uncharacterized protein n=1 Tax=Paraburkholderia tropica TaxID=92647 RepID=A0A1A5X8H9_9BURK|nr:MULTISPECIES: hypothetical protein [Paraburkholderia]MBB2978615.1 hypothetical protein [Paraburkholderia tropica]MBB2998808.1 hypothetical protein [Paraburkholderia tropica]MBB6318416.1 hypothetical protein [Paraburkholderia tropica]MDE1139337.1 hypothetical protein [Paraburkholderia tropica]OBR49737.1 hypothetical protein A6456_28155 [Paraburkholderia tropica]